MRRASLLFFLLVLIIVQMTSISAQQPPPSLELLNLMRLDDLMYEFLVQVNDECRPIVFGDLGYAYMDTSGILDITFYPFNGYWECNGTELQSYSIEYHVGQLYTVMIYPDIIGNPNFSLFNNDLSAPSPGRTRVSLRNGSSLSSLTYVIQRQGNSLAMRYTVLSGQQIVIELLSGKWLVSLPEVSEPVASFTQDDLYRPGEFWAIEASDNVVSGILLGSREFGD